jgi:NADH-quinone oxidoreductase subunit M
LAIALSGTNLVLASWVLWVAASTQASPSEIHPWIPALGAAVLLGGDELTLILVVWVALSTTLALALTRPRAGTAAWVLFLEAMVVALFLAQDVFLIFAALGGAAIAIAFLSGTPRKLLVIETAGLTVLFGWFAVVYRMVYEQTGFVSTELARWQTLVLYPHEARCLFLLGSFGIAWMMLALALAMDTAPRAGQLVLSATFLLFGSNFVLRVLMPLNGPRGEAADTLVVVFAALLMVSAFLARGWSWLSAGYQGLVLFGLFSREEAVAGALVMMIAAAVGSFGIRLTRAPSVIGFFVVFLVALSLATVVVPAWAGERLFAVAATLGFAILTHRMVLLAIASTRSEPDRAERRSGFWFAVPVVLWSISMVAGWGVWESRVAPWARTLTQQSSSGPLP